MEKRKIAVMAALAIRSAIEEFKQKYPNAAIPWDGRIEIDGEKFIIPEKTE